MHSRTCADARDEVPIRGDKVCVYCSLQVGGTVWFGFRGDDRPQKGAGGGDICGRSI